jgi:hypothetical protein
MSDATPGFSSRMSLVLIQIVALQHADWAQEAMLKGWGEVVGKKGPKPRLKVDYPVAII